MDNIYLNLTYNSKARWMGYWYQISETLEVSPDNVLVIGKGSGITERTITQLSNKKTRVLTLDVNYAVNSDIVGEVTGLPFANDTFDVVLCCQILEHLPFEKLPPALSELHRVVKKRVILSFPHSRRYMKLSCSLPFSKERRLFVYNPFARRHNKEKQHYWESGRGLSQKQVVNQINRLFDIEKDFLNEVSSDHKYYVLKRKNIWK